MNEQLFDRKRVWRMYLLCWKGWVELGNKVSFFLADLTKDDGWSEAVKNSDYVFHVASPFPTHQPKDENELIIPAREGTLRILNFLKKQELKEL